ncbi:MAG: NAD-dependent epimerase/dehydratase family protein [Ruminococcus sp.]|nr:NAD-dependent epimerase/dehydratase family protein [Ruminococcus sp.]
MKILILGGTGAMGVSLVNILKTTNHDVYITSRTDHKSEGNVHYIKTNAKDESSIKEIIKENYDVIIDFLIYDSATFKNRVNLFLSHTDQYFFFSSSRVYSNLETPITENTPRLLDSIEDKAYLKTDEYALAKAREENILTESGKSNWTIIRPYITYNYNRLQLGVYEKEHWLCRALTDRKIVVPADILSKKTCFTYAEDVAQGIFLLVGNDKALGEKFHIVNEECKTWKDILDIYLSIIENLTGKRPEVLELNDSTELLKVWGRYQILYDRLYDRVFDSSKIKSLAPNFLFTSISIGLDKCVRDYIANGKYKNSSNIMFDAWCDRMSGTFRIPALSNRGIKNQLRYIKYYFIHKNSFNS